MELGAPYMSATDYQLCLWEHWSEKRLPGSPEQMDPEFFSQAEFLLEDHK